MKCPHRKTEVQKFKRRVGPYNQLYRCPNCFRVYRQEGKWLVRVRIAGGETRCGLALSANLFGRTVSRDVPIVGRKGKRNEAPRKGGKQCH
jgi:hypothetical protein